MRNSTLGAIGATTLVLALVLTGCANPVEQITEKILEDQTGTKIDSDSDGGFTLESEDGSVQIGPGVEKPRNFPSDVPYPAGTLTGVVEAAGGWSLTFESVEQADLDRIVSELTAGGFQEAYVAKQAEVFQGTYTGGAWGITIVWDGSAGSSKALLYGVTPIE